MKSVKNQDKSINETSVSSISTDWSIQSIAIKSDLPIFIDLAIDKSVPIFIDWLYSGVSQGSTISTVSHAAPVRCKLTKFSLLTLQGVFQFSKPDI